MGVNANIAGIAQSGPSGSYAYSVIGSGARPVTFVSWYDSARFVNWLQNGQPTGLQTSATTERGAYTLNGAMSGAGVSRNAGTTYCLPSQNEWYKAAYYQPVAQGGPASSYWLYATRSNVQPNSRNGSASDPNSANYIYDDGIDNGYNSGFAVPGGFTSNKLTDVGAFSLAHSFYGTFDQDGNVFEWNDTAVLHFGQSTRGLLGGAWGSDAASLSASDGTYADTYYSSTEDQGIGFRIAMVPEPTVVELTTLGVALLAWKRRRTL